MQRLVPAPAAERSPTELVGSRTRTGSGRPWVLVNMIASIDGSATLDGVSTGLGGPADRAMFGALRAAADIILVGSGTVAAENYGPPRTSDDHRAERRDRGQAEWPRLAIVSRSLRLDFDSPLFTDTPSRPILVTTDDADPDRVAAAEAVAEIRRAGADSVSLVDALGQLGDGHTIVLSEGGPSLNGQLLTDDLIDEINLTVAPLVSGTSRRRIIEQPETAGAVPAHFALEQVVLDGDMLFLRYVADRHRPDGGHGSTGTRSP